MSQIGSETNFSEMRTKTEGLPEGCPEEVGRSGTIMSSRPHYAAELTWCGLLKPGPYPKEAPTRGVVTKKAPRGKIPRGARGSRPEPRSSQISISDRA